MIYIGMNMEQISYHLPVFCQVCGMRQKREKNALFNYLHVAVQVVKKGPKLYETKRFTIAHNLSPSSAT